MHMADALLSPVVGGGMLAVSAGLIGWCARRVRQTLDDRLVPMMGVLGAFIFAAQMINFPIPATGSSGHLGGGLLLAILLGPSAAFIVIASVLTVQALFFQDGGLLALGCNIFNLGFFPAFFAYPLIARPIIGEARDGTRLWTGSILAAVAGLLMGAVAVVLETTISGISDLPFKTFAFMMMPVHLAIGVVEGVVTAAVAAFILRARPAMTNGTSMARADSVRLKRVTIGFLVAAAFTAAVLSWFASAHPDGLEWAIGKVRGGKEMEDPRSGIHGRLAQIQAKTAVMPDYGFSAGARMTATNGYPAGTQGGRPDEAAAPGPVRKAARSVAGLVGGLLTLLLAALLGLVLTRRRAWSRQ